MKISASIFAKKEENLAVLVSELKRIGVSMLHIDCKDDERVITTIFEHRDKLSLPLDVHLIGEKSGIFAEKFAELNVSRLCLQYESLSQIPESFWNINTHKGIAITSHTPIAILDEFPQLDFVMLMCTEPGESGGKFEISNFGRINEIKHCFPKLKITIDGGVNSEVAFILKLLGVDTVVSGSYLLDKNEYSLNMLNLLLPTANNSFSVKDFAQSAKSEPVLELGKFDFREAVQTIENHKTGYAIVVDENRKFIGVITNADVRKALLKNWDNLANLPYEEYVNFQPISTRETDSLQTMLNLIESQNRIILFLPVVNAIGEFTGTIPLNNLARG